jgi:MoxR-like ATPase
MSISTTEQVRGTEVPMVVLTPEEKKFGQELARNFAIKFETEVSKIIVGEDDAIRAACESLVNGSDRKPAALVLGGLAGVGKTTLELAIASGIKGVNIQDKEEFVRIPVDPRLTFPDVFGSIVRVERNIYDEQGMVVRTYTEEVPMKGLVNEKAKIVIYDEFEKGSEMVQNGGLEVAEEKQVTTTAGTIILDNYLLTVMTINGFNPLGSNSDIADPLSAPAASRIPIGVIMGDTNEEIPGRTAEINSTILTMLDGDGKSIKIEPFVTIEELKTIRRYASQIVRDEKANSEGLKLVREAREVLEFHGIFEGYNRIAVQIGSVARAIAATEGEILITPEIMTKATRRVVTARLIARSILSASAINNVASKFMVSE